MWYHTQEEYTLKLELISLYVRQMRRSQLLLSSTMLQNVCLGALNVSYDHRHNPHTAEIFGKSRDRVKIIN
jgi:hypothetical protein